MRSDLMLFSLSLVCAVAAFPAAAASLGGLKPADLVAGQAAISACDTAVDVDYATSGGQVQSVTVRGIADPACEGGILKLQLLGPSGAGLATGGPVLVAPDPDTNDDSLNVPVSPPVPAVDVETTAISIGDA